MKQFDTVIVGAGLAGLTCGLELADKGKKVIVLESKPVVGGRTSSSIDQGIKIEAGFHRFVGFYPGFSNVLKKAGIELDDLFLYKEKADVRIQHKNKFLTFSITPAAVPVKLVKGVLKNNKEISPRDQACLLSFFLTGFKDFYFSPQKLDNYNVQQYAEKHKVSEEAFYLFVAPLSTGFTFFSPERTSAYVFFGFLFSAAKRFHKMRLSTFLGGMVETVSRRMAEAIVKKGSIVQTSQTVRKLIWQDGKITGVVLESGSILYGKNVVLSNNLHGTKQLLDPLFSNHPWFQPMFKLPTLPAVRLHIKLKENLGTEKGSMANRHSMIAFSENAETIFEFLPGKLSVILTAPENFITKTPEQILEHVLKDAKQIGFNFEESILDYRQVKDENNCYSLKPGYGWMRPTQKTPVKGLVLAGDYTRQPFFSSMEGAVVSGQRAATLILKSLGH